jgi:hypothetical protein
VNPLAPADDVPVDLHETMRLICLNVSVLVVVAVICLPLDAGLPARGPSCQAQTWHYTVQRAHPVAALETFQETLVVET